MGTSCSRWMGCLAVSLLAADVGCVAPDDTGQDVARGLRCGEPGTVSGLVCGVGVSDGRLAVQFNGQWFALDYADGTWGLTNKVEAEVADVVPVDEETETQDESCPCGRGTEEPTRECYINKCGGPRPPIVKRQTRRFRVAIGELQYDVVATQEVIDRRVRARDLDEDLRVQRDMKIEIKVDDPIDRNPWTVVVLPKRIAAGAVGSQEEVNERATTPGTETQSGTAGTLFDTSNVDYDKDVELGAATKVASANAAEMLARSNVAMNRALEDALPDDGEPFQEHAVPEALTTSGSVLSRVQGPGGATSLFDLQRFSQFYMDTRRGQAGYSNRGGGERPMAETRPREWRFRHNILNYDVYFPFLAGLCGFEAHLSSYVAGALSYGRRSCFDGLVTNVDARGSMEFALAAGGGLGCNLLVASASAGLEASVRALAQFETTLQTAPPRLSAAVSLYSEVALSAYFRVRVLFWSKKWEKRVGFTRLFQREAKVELAPVGNPALALCDPGADPSGTCTDPSASCDVLGRCIRYEFGAPGTTPRTSNPEPRRVDVGACFIPPAGTGTDTELSVETRQFIPNDIPGLPAASLEGRVCDRPSSPYQSPPGAVQDWLSDGYARGQRVPVWSEPPGPDNPGIYWFSGDARGPTTQRDARRRLSIAWDGKLRLGDGGPILQAARFSTNGNHSFRFRQPDACLVDAGHAVLRGFDPNNVAPTHPNASYFAEAAYPLNALAPTIKQKLAVTQFNPTDGGKGAMFHVAVRHTLFPWHETVLHWGDKSYGLQNWQSGCPGPGVVAFNQFQNEEMWVKVSNLGGQKRVHIATAGSNTPDWKEVSPGGWGITLRGPTRCGEL